MDLVMLLQMQGFHSGTFQNYNVFNVVKYIKQGYPLRGVHDVISIKGDCFAPCVLWSGCSFCHCMLWLVAASLALRYLFPTHVILEDFIW
jgi:hypothetical protein